MKRSWESTVSQDLEAERSGGQLPATEMSNLGSSNSSNTRENGLTLLLQPDKPRLLHCQRRQLCGPCCSGMVIGVALGLLLGAYLPSIIFSISGHDLLPTVIHKMAVSMLSWSVCPLLVSGGCVCCAMRRGASYTSSACDRSLPTAAAATIVIATILLSLPTAGHADLLQVIHLLFGSPAWPARGYCAASAVAAASRALIAANGSGALWWHEWGESAEEAARALAGAMSREERHSLLNGEAYGPFGQLDGAYVGGTGAVNRLLVPSLQLQDAGQGFRTSKRVIVGRVTSWPCMLALAATWDVDLTRRYAEALGTEFKDKGANVILGPSLNVHRVARNGRNAEYLSGEEPYLGARLAAAYVEGVQSKGVAAVAKHFVLNSQESDRMSTSALASDRALFEVYYEPFRAAIDAGAASIMCAYNRVNGSHACGSEKILTADLREALGFEGWVMSDWWALRASSAATHGVDQDMPGNDGYFDLGALGSLPDGESLELLMATRVLRGMLRSGALNRSVCTQGCDCEDYLYARNATSEAHAALAREVASASAVLLKNEGGVLPLRSGSSIALVGSACGAAHDIDPEGDWTAGDYYVVGGSGRVVSDRAVSIRAALEQRGRSNLVVSSSDSLSEALEAAAAADVVVACGSGVTYESADRRTLRLDQHDLLIGLSEASISGQLGAPLVVAVMAPGQVATAPWSDGASGVLTIFLAGQATGNAWADVLFGDVNPSGKLPVTFPLHDSDMTPPCVGSQADHCVYTEGLHVGWRALTQRPVGFAFGSGLSYSHFTYEWGSRPSRDSLRGEVTLSVVVTNVGDAEGAEVLQLYARFPPAAAEPPLVLKAFEKTPRLRPLDSHIVHFTLSARQLMVWDPQPSVRDWRAMPGGFKLLIGSSSRDIRLEHDVTVPEF
jgi:beta-glucosidase